MSTYRGGRASPSGPFTTCHKPFKGAFIEYYAPYRAQNQTHSYITIYSPAAVTAFDPNPTPILGDEFSDSLIRRA